MTSGWMVKQDGNQAGPYSFEQLVSQAKAGTLKPDALVRTVETESWTRAEQIRGLFPEAAQGKANPAPASPSGGGNLSGGKPAPAPVQKAAGKTAKAKKSPLLPLLAIAAGLLLLIGGSVLAFSVVAQNGGGAEEEGEVLAGEDLEEGGQDGDFLLIPFDGFDQDDLDNGGSSGGGNTGGGSNNNQGGSSGNGDDNDNDSNGGNGNDSNGDDNGDDSNGGNGDDSNGDDNDSNGGGSGAEKAEIQFATFPAGARLYIDGVYVGNTPHTAHLRMGTYNIAFRKDGYREQSGGINVTSSRMQILSISLEEEGQEPPVQDPVAKISISPGTLRVNETVRFSGFDSRSPGGQVTGYSWDFCQGESGSGLNVERVFDQSGTYQVRLTVTDNRGNSASETRQFSVAEAEEDPDAPEAEEDPSPPEASFTISPANPYEMNRITFDASGSSSLSGDIVRYSWVFNDGDPIVRYDPVYRKSSLGRGDYTVTLTVRDSEGNEASVEKHFRVRPPLLVPEFDPLEASFTFSPEQPAPLHQVTFDASGSSSPHGEIIAYYWQFGDGVSREGSQYEQVTYNYREAGRYTVTLTIIDAMGNTETTTEEVPVYKTEHIQIMEPVFESLNEDTRVSIFVKRLTVIESYQKWHVLAGLRDPRDVAISCFVLSGLNDPPVEIPSNILLHDRNFILKTGEQWSMNLLLHEAIYVCPEVELELSMIAHHHTSSPSSGPYVSKGAIKIPVNRDQLDEDESNVTRVRAVNKHFILDQQVREGSPIKAKILVEIVVIYTLPLPGESSRVGVR